MKKLLWAFCFSIPLFFQSCYYDNFSEINPAIEDSCIVPDTVSFNTHIMPILNASCGTSSSGCHENDAATGLGLSNYSEVISTVQDATPTEFLQRINHDPAIDPSKWMPKDAPKLSDCDISKFQKWFNDGLRNN